MGTANTAPASSQHCRASPSTFSPLEPTLQWAHSAYCFTGTTREKHFSSICAPTRMLGDQIPSKTHSLACRRSWRRAGFASGLDPANFILKNGKKPFSASSHRHSAATSCPAVLPQPLPHTPLARGSRRGSPPPEALCTKRAGSWTGEGSRANPKQDPAPRRAETGSKEPWAAPACSAVVPPWGNGPAVRKNVAVSHLQDLRSQEVCVQSFSGSSCLKSKSSESALAITDAAFDPTGRVGAQDPTGCSPILQSIGQV